MDLFLDYQAIAMNLIANLVAALILYILFVRNP